MPTPPDLIVGFSFLKGESKMNEIQVFEKEREIMEEKIKQIDKKLYELKSRHIETVLNLKEGSIIRDSNGTKHKISHFLFHLHIDRAEVYANPITKNGRYSKSVRDMGFICLCYDGKNIDHKNTDINIY